MNLLEELPSHITCIEDVRDFLLALMRAGKLFHLDEDPSSMFFVATDCPMFTPEEGEHIRYLQECADTFTREWFNKVDDKQPNAAIWDDVIVDIMGFGWIAMKCNDTVYVHDYVKTIKVTTFSRWTDIVAKCMDQSGDIDQTMIEGLISELPDVEFN